MLAVTIMAAETDDLSQLKSFFKNVAAYDSHYTQEKVYLHLDNNGYFPKEKIWYKAYVFRASTLLPTDMSKVLYVELVTPTGEVKERQTLPIYNGRTYGDFDLKDIFQTGYYEIRAYTRSMLNWDASYIYSRVIPIFNIPEDTTQFTKLSMYADPVDEKLLRKRPVPAPLLTKDCEREGRLMMTFYPEGGQLTKGVAGRVAYKMTDETGRAFSTLLTLYRSNGEKVESTHPLHEGMGLLELPADWTGGFVKAVDSKGEEQSFKLPAAQETGCRMEVGTDASDNVVVKITPHGLPGNALLGLTATCRGRLAAFDTLHVKDGAVTKTFKRNRLRDGIQQITLFNPEGGILAERLVWVEPQQKPAVFDVKQNKESYSPFSPVVLDFSLKDAEGHPQQSEFSLSVQDVGGMVAGDGMSLKTDMLLCSDLKGYINKPEYYFENNDEEHRKALDLLLMVQGWRRYEWKEMAGVDSIKVKQPVEDAQILDGKIGDFSKDHEGKAGVNVNLVLLDGLSLDLGTAKTDSVGHFAMKFSKDIYDDNYGYFTITKGKDKRITSDVMLNRTFRPAALAYEPQELFFEKPMDLRRSETIARPELFAWKDTIPQRKIHSLPAVKKKAAASRFTRYELNAENAAREEGVLYYNVEEEMEKMNDQGTLDILIWDWLKKRNAYFDYEKMASDYTPNIYMVNNSLVTNNAAIHPIEAHGADAVPPNPLFFGDIENYYDYNMLRYHHKKVALAVIDNGQMVINYEPYLSSEIKSLVICRNTSNVKKMFPQLSNSFITRNGYLVSSEDFEYLFILTKNQQPQMMTDYRKGVRATLIHGYSKTSDFYSPNYRTEALPDPADVRRTLYWNPTVETDKEGKARVVLFSNSRKNQQIHVNAQGIAVNGKMFGTEK